MKFKWSKRFREEILKALQDGPKTTPQLYKILKQRCPEYCDDSERCTHYKLTGTRQPEWKHRVRGIQNAMQKEFLIYLDKENGVWRIVE